MATDEQGICLEGQIKSSIVPPWRVVLGCRDLFSPAC